MQNAKLVGTRPGQVALRAAAALLLVAAALLIFLQPSLEAQGNDKATSNLAVTSPNSGGGGGAGHDLGRTHRRAG